MPFYIPKNTRHARLSHNQLWFLFLDTSGQWNVSLPASKADWVFLLISLLIGCLRNTHSQELASAPLKKKNKNILFIYFLREGKGGRKRGRETSVCERNPTRDLTRNLGMCPDPESKRWPFFSLWVVPNPLSHTSQGGQCFFSHCIWSQTIILRADQGNSGLVKLELLPAIINSHWAFWQGLHQCH